MSARAKKGGHSRPTTKAGRAIVAERNAVKVIDKILTSSNQEREFGDGGRRVFRLYDDSTSTGRIVGAVEFLKHLRERIERFRHPVADQGSGAASSIEAALIPAGEQGFTGLSTDGSSNTLKEQLAQLTGRYAFEARELVEAHISRVMKSLGGL